MEIFKPRLSGENSIIMSLATVGLVVALYNSKIGPVADVHATDANDINVNASIHKAGWEAASVVAAIGLLAGDRNIIILGGAAVIAEEVMYRHANMTHPGTGQLAVTPASYMPAGGNVTSLAATG